MPGSASTVAVVGAAGFVGRHLLSALEKRGVRATAVARGAPEMAAGGDFHEVCSPAGASSVPGGFDTVINLAYPNSGPAIDYPDQNRAIEETVRSLVRDGGRLIHVSTLAVFGLALDRPVHVGHVSAVRDLPYVEAKIAAEIAFRQLQASGRLSLDVVRFGNVWGTGSAAWGVPIVQRLITGRPVGVAGAVGLSNTTDVANAAAYLMFLLERGETTVGVRYHHLSEFSAVPWRDWIEPVAEVLRVEPVYEEPAGLTPPESARQELSAAIAGPRAIYRSLAGERVAGSWSRSLLRRLPSPVYSAVQGKKLIHATPPPLDRGEQTFLAIMAGQREFKSAVHGGWTPTVDQRESLRRFLQWLSWN